MHAGGTVCSITVKRAWKGDAGAGVGSATGTVDLMRGGSLMDPRRVFRVLSVAAVISFLALACGSSATSAPTGAPTPIPSPSAIPSPSIGRVRDAKDLMTAREAGDLMGDTIKRAGPGKVDLRLGRLNGWSFTGERYRTRVIVGIAPADGAGTDECKPAAKCPAFDAVKKGQPKGAEAFIGIGDDAFGAWQQGQGRPPILMGARKGRIAVYVWVDTLVYQRLKDFLPTLIARI